MAQLLRHKDAQACHAKLRNSKSIIYLKAVDTVPPASPDDAMPYVVVAAILVCALALVLSRSPPSRCLRPITNGASAGRMGVEIARQGALRLQKLKCLSDDHCNAKSSRQVIRGPRDGLLFGSGMALNPPPTCRRPAVFIHLYTFCITLELSWFAKLEGWQNMRKTSFELSTVRIVVRASALKPGPRTDYKSEAARRTD